MSQYFLSFLRERVIFVQFYGEKISKSGDDIHIWRSGRCFLKSAIISEFLHCHFLVCDMRSHSWTYTEKIIA
jgi:hypothetical protein